MRDEAPSHEGRRAAALVTASLLVHLAIVLLIPAPPPDDDDDDDAIELAPIELVEWSEPAAPTPVQPPEPTPPPVEPPTEPAPPPTPSEPQPRTPRPESSSGTPAPSAPTTPPPPAAAPTGPTTDAPGDAPAALPLGTRSAGSGISSPRLSGSALRDAPVDPPAAPGPVVVERTDGKPRTLADAGFLRDKKGELVYKDPLGHFNATLMPDGRVRFRDYAIARGTVKTGGKVMGLTELIRMGQKKELWWLDKRKLLERTEELRFAMALRWAESQLDRRLAGLYRDLLEIWTDDGRTVEQRRARLFERWDECVEAMNVQLVGFEIDDRSSLDEMREKAGGQARTSIEGFIRKHLPKGSPDAYTEDELKALNRRRHSTESFDPYSGSP